MINLSEFENNDVIDAFYKCRKHLSNHSNVVVLYSGGSDSDITVDFVIRTLRDDLYKELLKDVKIKYVFYDTGIEYDATKRHLDDIEWKAFQF